MKKKIILIGVNHAGTSFLKFIRNKYEGGEITAYDQNDNVSFLGCGIALWVGQEIIDNDPKLFYATPKKLRDLNVNLKMKHQVQEINNSALNKKIKVKVFDLDTKETFWDECDYLVIATGSRPVGFIDNLPNRYSKGVHVSKLFSDAEGIIKNAQEKRVKDVVVVGAGYIGIELTEAFWKLGKRVTLIDAEQRIMPRYYDEEFTKLLQEEMTTKTEINSLNVKREKIKLQLGEKIIGFESDEEKRLKCVVTEKLNESGKKERQSYPAQLAVLGLGFWPRTNIFENKIETEKGNKAIIVDKEFRTSDKRIFAIGDCISIYNNSQEETANIALATNAIRSALVAAANIASDCKLKEKVNFLNGSERKEEKKRKITSLGVQGTNAISVFGWKLAATGLNETVLKNKIKNSSTDEEKKRWEYESCLLIDNVLPEFMKKNEKIIIKVIWSKEKRNIIGAQIASKENHAETIYFFSLAIMKKLTIDELPLVDLLFLPHFNKPYNFVTMLGLKALGFIKKEETQIFTRKNG